MDYYRILLNINAALDALSKNKIRAILTSLGIIFGVSAVISMLAIGNGAEKEILEQIKQVGSNNIIIKPIFDANNTTDLESDKNKKYSPGLSLLDVTNLSQTITDAKFVSPEIEMEAIVLREGLKTNGKLIGIENSFFDISSNVFEMGAPFSTTHLENAEQVCIIGSGIKNKLFANENPLGKKIKCGKNWLTIVGVLGVKHIDDKNKEKLQVRNINMDVFVPIKTFLLRYKNRSLVTKATMKKTESDSENNKKPKIKQNYNQLDKITVQLNNSAMLSEAATLIERILLRRHNNVQDFEIIIPELLLKQEQRTKKLFNTVLGIIASISLLVGGIGIMNIMLASVMERTKEIGIRMSLGATRTDVVTQFLSEAVMISIGGGLLGVILGIIASYSIESITNIQTIITPLSVIISFVISISVGLIFGIMPASKASKQDPIQSLRYE
jgi:putative ABC transport system permease protein